MYKKTHFFLQVVFIFLFLNTPIWAQITHENHSSSLLQSIIDAVDIDSIYQTERHITGEETFLLNGQLDSILSRYSYSAGITVAQNYLKNRFEKMGYAVELQPFNNTLNNIIVTKTGTTYPDQYFILGAHYDSTSPLLSIQAPGADDNGSGTAAVIEAARVLKPYEFNYSIKFILFSGEEIGLDGSREYAENAYFNDEQIEGFINLDMIGYDGNDDGIFEIHTGYISESQLIGSIVAENITKWNLSVTAEIYSGRYSTDRSDHYNFWLQGYPAILIIEDFFDSNDRYPYYHSLDDVLSKLNPEFLHNLSRLSIGSLAVLAEIDSIVSGFTANDVIPRDFLLFSPYPNPFNPTVTIEYCLPFTNHVKIEIYNSLGRKIKELVNQNIHAGVHHISWDSRDSFGEPSASGVYFVLMKTTNYIGKQKILLMR